MLRKHNFDIKCLFIKMLLTVCCYYIFLALFNNYFKLHYQLIKLKPKTTYPMRSISAELVYHHGPPYPYPFPRYPPPEP